MTRRYPAYKDSGVEWLGEVPEGWDITRLGTCFSERREKVSDKDHPALSVTMGGIVPQIETAAKTDDGDNRKRVCKGDFVINSRSDRKGSSGLSLLNGSVSLISIVLSPKGKIAGPFSNWLLKSQNFQDEFYRWGSGIVADLWSTRYKDMKAITLALPPLPEQRAIAAFLDRETTKIDALVAEQRRLIDLLREKRQAVISHAVTRGLNPDAPLKSSGIDWLGDVPEGWEVMPLKRLTNEITVGIVVEPSKYYAENGIPALRSLNVRPGQIVSDNLVFISAEANELLQKSQLHSGDLVAVRTGQPGTCAVVEDDFAGCNCIDLIIVRKPTTTDSHFLRWYLTSDVAVRQFVEGSGGAIQQHFNVGTAMELTVIVPPVADQTMIVAYLESLTAKLDALTATAESAIDLLQERRAALISATVTGKIDVRHLVSKETEAA
ncbi:hypothetical protein [Jannaschia sp. 2305UL9-9]|uniref:hypothetical protein n=1 Tax=Jannaschia sp. 2305UL9-9 TaxID=3121638 RepID=UPI00352884F7